MCDEQEKARSRAWNEKENQAGPGAGGKRARGWLRVSLPWRSNGGNLDLYPSKHLGSARFKVQPSIPTPTLAYHLHTHHGRRHLSEHRTWETRYFSLLPFCGAPIGPGGKCITRVLINDHSQNQTSPPSTFEISSPRPLTNSPKQSPPKHLEYYVGLLAGWLIMVVKLSAVCATAM